MTTPRVISRDTTSTELDSDYKWGFTIDIDSDLAPKGLSEDVVRLISAKKEEPEWLLEWRLKAFRHWERLQYREPEWANIHHDPIDYQDIYYYAAPSTKEAPKSLDEVDPEVLEAFDKLGIPPPGNASGWPAWPWTRCWTAYRWQPPTRICWKRKASSSAP